MLNKLISAVLITSVCFGCSAHGSKERARLEELVSKSVTIGASRESVIQFFQSQGWKPKITHVKNYGDLYSTTFFEDEKKDHSVLIEIWVSDENKVKSFRVIDAYTSL